MIYSWFFIFNSAEFEALDLPSKTYTVILEGIGRKNFLVTKSNYLGMTYEDVFLPLNVNDKNPFEFESLAVYKDENNDVFLGILDET